MTSNRLLVFPSDQPLRGFNLLGFTKLCPIDDERLTKDQLLFDHSDRARALWHDVARYEVANVGLEHFK